jgi:hypothetical protein
VLRRAFCRSGIIREVGTWTFLTNHAHVLITVARDPGIRLRDIASAVGITERTAQQIVSDLVEGGYLRREKDGRRNTYQCVSDLPLRHPVESDHAVGELLAARRGRPFARMTCSRRSRSQDFWTRR